MFNTAERVYMCSSCCSGVRWFSRVGEQSGMDEIRRLKVLIFVMSFASNYSTCDPLTVRGRDRIVIRVEALNRSLRPSCRKSDEVKRGMNYV